MFCRTRNRPQPASIDPRGAIVLAVLAFSSSLALRGPRRSLRLLAYSIIVASAAEVLAIRGARALRHHSRPQPAELPLSLPLLW